MSIQNTFKIWLNKTFYTKIKDVMNQQYQNYLMQSECTLNRKIKEKLKVDTLPKHLQVNAIDLISSQ